MESPKRRDSAGSGEALAKRIRALMDRPRGPLEMQVCLQSALTAYEQDAPKRDWQVHLKAVGRFSCVIPLVRAYSPEESAAIGAEMASNGQLGFIWKYESGEVINTEAFQP